MDRRQFSALCIASLAAVTYSPATFGQTLPGISARDATLALRAALEKGVIAAIAQLGRIDGFMGNDQLRIPLPANLQGVEKILRQLGQGGQLDELVLAMNRGAESAVPMARTLMLHAVNALTVDDARSILAGGETAVTQYFAGKTRSELQSQFLPIVRRATERVGLAGKYNAFAGRGAELGLISQKDANLERYVTDKALDGLFSAIGEEERKIRKNPVAYGSTLLTKVFGSLR